ncbi:phosphoglycerate mutase family protein [Aspergillus lucknowensis]|uniref:Phosphoglycerate mutase-like protein n=1 Tax=Aspergillus lucknowensis TaxID=176173 RepID=A0ABR4LVK0_9EURO
MANPNQTPQFHYHFSTVTGIFLQDEETTDASKFDFASTDFGLIPRAYPSDAEFDPNNGKTQWERLAYYIEALNRHSPPDTQYKLLFLGRHGQGVHNCHYSLLNGDDDLTWFDALLTDVGISQARTVNETWKAQIKKGIPHPQSYYVSPLRRCCETARVSFEESGLRGTEPFQPLVKELLRETLGLHTCDARSPKSVVEAAYPKYVFEDGFSEEDRLHVPDLRESDSARDVRFIELLSDIFASDGNSVLSLTTHSGAIMSILHVVGHRKFTLETGGVIPVLVRGERKEGKGEKGVVEPWWPKPECPKN